MYDCGIFQEEKRATMPKYSSYASNKNYMPQQQNNMQSNMQNMPQGMQNNMPMGKSTFLILVGEFLKKVKKNKKLLHKKDIILDL